MSLNRSEKEAVISEVTSLAAKAQTLVMAEYRGITVAAMDKLRVNARSNGVSLSVLKNTLARRAVASRYGLPVRWSAQSASTPTAALEGRAHAVPSRLACGGPLAGF